MCKIKICVGHDIVNCCHFFPKIATKLALEHKKCFDIDKRQIIIIKKLQHENFNLIMENCSILIKFSYIIVIKWQLCFKFSHYVHERGYCLGHYVGKL